MHFLTRIEKIFCSKNIRNNNEIFLDKEVCQGPKNIQEFSQIFVGKKNEGCFGVEVTEVLFHRENEYLSFKKNIPKVIFGCIRGKGMSLEVR